MASKLSFEEAVARNEVLPCKNPECYRPRKDLSGYCRDCRFRVYAYGRPFGGCLKVTDYAMELDEIRALLMVNMDHEGVTDTCERLSSIIGRAVEQEYSDNPTIPQVSLWANFARHEITPIDMIHHSAAIYLFSMRPRGRTFIPDHEAFLKGMGNRVTLLAPSPKLSKNRWKRPSPRQTRELGRFYWTIASSISVLLAHEADKIEKVQRERLKRFHKPFNRPL